MKEFINPQSVTWEFKNPIQGVYLTDELIDCEWEETFDTAQGKHTSVVEVFVSHFRKELYDKYGNDTGHKYIDYHTQYFTDDFVIELKADITYPEVIRLAKGAVKKAVAFCKKYKVPTVKLDIRGCSCAECSIREHQHCPKCNLVLSAGACPCGWAKDLL